MTRAVSGLLTSNSALTFLTLVRGRGVREDILVLAQLHPVLLFSQITEGFVQTFLQRTPIAL